MRLLILDSHGVDKLAEVGARLQPFPYDAGRELDERDATVRLVTKRLVAIACACARVAKLNGLWLRPGQGSVLLYLCFNIICLRLNVDLFFFFV